MLFYQELGVKRLGFETRAFFNVLSRTRLNNISGSVLLFSI
jgi:hypothetical protein